jgi:hypothetical protein
MAPHGGGQLRADPDLRISQVADGKAMGTYWAKIEEQNSDETTQFTSRIEATPDGLPRMAFKTTNGANLEGDLMSDGDFKLSGPAGFQAVLKRVGESK